MVDLVSVSTGVLGQLVASLLQGGEDNTISKLILKKIEDLGKEKIADLIKETPLGEGFSTQKRFMSAIESGGATEFNRARDQWLNSVKQSLDYKTSGAGATRFAKRIDSLFQKTAQDQSRPDNGHWKWSKSRKEWLNQDWRHDWRSQPRNAAGRWIPGRLGYIFVSNKAKKVRSARRRAVRKNVRKMMRGHRDDNQVG